MPDHPVQLVTRHTGDKVSCLFHFDEKSELMHPIFPRSILVYEGGSVLTQARSLWRIELARTKWSGGYVNWYHPMRIRHITTGLYLGTVVDADTPGELVLLKR